MNPTHAEQPRSDDGRFGSKPTVVKAAEQFVDEALDKAGVVPDEPVWTDDGEDLPWYGDGGYSAYRRSAHRKKGKKAKKMTSKRTVATFVFWMIVIILIMAMV